MTRYFYDTEFLEDGVTIELISIGIVAEDGREYYAVNAEAPWKRIAEHEWLVTNVVPSLPRLGGDARQHWMDSRTRRRNNPLYIDHSNNSVKPKQQIAADVKHFLLWSGAPELFAWYAAYDHVALAQLFGPMSEMPVGIPYFTNDLKQECARLGYVDSDLPEQPDGVHNALADARHNKIRYEWLKAQGPR
jgi:hypothetical protein